MKKKKKNKNDIIINGILVAVIIFAVLTLGYSIKVMFFPSEMNSQATSQAATQMPTMGRMSLTSYDKELGRRLMDKDNDGKCDACGMPVEMCMDSGQLQCNMDPSSTIGLLGSQHIHADLKVYINGKVLDFSDKAHMDRMKSNLPVSSFIHVDSGASAQEKTGDVLHMHAKGVPLWIFFESIEVKLSESIKVYVNGKLEPEGLNYVFKDLDKVLITDADGNVDQQLDSITDYAKIH